MPPDAYSVVLNTAATRLVEEYGIPVIVASGTNLKRPTIWSTFGAVSVKEISLYAAKLSLPTAEESHADKSSLFATQGTSIPMHVPFHHPLLMGL